MGADTDCVAPEQLTCDTKLPRVVVDSIAEVRARRLSARDTVGSVPNHVDGVCVLGALRRLAAGEFPKQSRPNVQPVGTSEVHGISLGLVSGRGTSNQVCLSKASRLLPGFTRLLCQFMRQHDPSFEFTSIQVNHGFASREHVDPHTEGPSWIYATGGFEGGELWVEDPTNGYEEHVCGVDIFTANGQVKYQKGASYRGQSLEVRNCWQHFDGRRL